MIPILTNRPENLVLYLRFYIGKYKQVFDRNLISFKKQRK
jgi:hypothetical protein